MQPCTRIRNNQGNDSGVCLLLPSIKAISGQIPQVKQGINPTLQIKREVKRILNGFYKNINSWRPDRDAAGWKLKHDVDTTYYWDIARGCVMSYTSSDRPKLAPVLDWLKDDVEALEILTAADRPPKLLARPTTRDRPTYMFGDASGQGFGMSIWTKPNEDVRVEYGTWTVAIRKRGHKGW